MHFLFSFCEDEDPGTILGGIPMVFQESKRFVPKIGRHGLSSCGVRQPWQRDRGAMDMLRGVVVTSDGGGRIVKKKLVLTLKETGELPSRGENQPFDDEGQLSVLCNQLHNPHS